MSDVPIEGAHCLCCCPPYRKKDARGKEANENNSSWFDFVVLCGFVCGFVLFWGDVEIIFASLCVLPQRLKTIVGVFGGNDGGGVGNQQFFQ